MTNLYTPLDIESYQIRVIFLHPGEKGSIIRCDLQRHTLVNPPQYTALSYCWGDETNKRPIMVDDTQVMVTINLEEALQQLREHHITLLWVDALCINQVDKQEKSLQIRNMKQVYAKAKATYAWLGPSSYDNAASAMCFLRPATFNVSLLRDKLHKHVLDSADSMEESTLVSKRNCQYCQVELSFRALLDLFDRPYWRRRWVIQEVTTAANSRVVCGSEILDLDHMSDAIQRCSRSKHWQPQHSSSYRFLKRILDFRKSYHHDKNLTLCRTILSTRNFLSKDDRDKVFALIGICKDGIELVPTPSYYRSVELVAAEITRELLRRNARFDLILLDHRDRCTPSSQLPTWSPDWFSEYLPENAYAIAEEQPYLSCRYGVRSLRGNMSTLHVQGIEIGTVMATTSILSSSSHPLTMPARDTSGRSPVTPDISNYYGRHTLAAIMTCLLASSSMLSLPMATNGSIHRHHLLQSIRPPANDKAWDIDEKKQQQSHSASLHQWLPHNRDFSICDRKLQDWMQISYCWYYLQIPYIMFCFLPLSISATVVALILPGALVASASAMASLPFNQSPITVPIIVIAISSFSLLFNMISTWGLIRKIKITVRKAVKTSPPPSTRLILMNTGALGMASSDVAVGDKICLIAGCKLSAAVLREKQVDDQILHTIIGRSMVCMSKRDEQRYAAFIGGGGGEGGTAPPEISGRPNFFVQLMRYVLTGLNPFRVYGSGEEVEAERYNQLIDEYALRDEWREFILI